MRRPHLLAGLAFAVAVGGCALHRPRPLRPTTADELIAGLAARRSAVGSLRASGRLRTGLSGLWTREAILVRRPDALRIDVLSPFGLALAVGVHGPVMWAYPARGDALRGAGDGGEPRALPRRPNRRRRRRRRAPRRAAPANAGRLPGPRRN